MLLAFPSEEVCSRVICAGDSVQMGQSGHFLFRNRHVSSCLCQNNTRVHTHTDVTHCTQGKPVFIRYEKSVLNPLLAAVPVNTELVLCEFAESVQDTTK